MGASTKSANGYALLSFYTGILSALRPMLNDVTGHHGPCSCKAYVKNVQSVFADKTHEWKVYFSNTVGMGVTPSAVDLSELAELLLPKIQERLGNQKVVCVKLFTSNLAE